MTDTIVDQLAAAIRQASIIPSERRLWDVEQIAAYVGVSASTVYRTMICKPGFPEAVKIEGGPLRWVAGEVMDWTERQRRPARYGKRAA